MEFLFRQEIRRNKFFFSEKSKSEKKKKYVKVFYELYAVK